MPLSAMMPAPEAGVEGPPRGPEAPPAYAIEVEDLHVDRGRTSVLHGVSCRLPRGELLGVLGPNGAGKTTLVKTLIGALRPRSGSVRLFGRDGARPGPAIRSRIGVTPQDDNLYEGLSVLENLVLHGRLFGMSGARIRARAGEVLELVGLEEARRRTVKSLSGGMKRRLVVARAIMHEPALLFLDEPTTGLDPNARQDVWRLLRGMKESRVSVLLTTHYMEEAEVLSDRVIVIDQGRIVAEGTPAGLRAAHAGAAVVVVSCERPEAEERVRAMWPDAVPTASPGELKIPVADIGEVPAVLARLRDEGIAIAGAHARPTTLEDVFFKLTGRGLTGG